MYVCMYDDGNKFVLRHFAKCVNISCSCDWPKVLIDYLNLQLAWLQIVGGGGVGSREAVGGAETACLKVTRVGSCKKYERLTSLPDGA